MPTISTGIYNIVDHESATRALRLSQLFFIFATVGQLLLAEQFVLPAAVVLVFAMVSAFATFRRRRMWGAVAFGVIAVAGISFQVWIMWRAGHVSVARIGVIVAYFFSSVWLSRGFSYLHQSAQKINDPEATKHA